MKSILLVLTSLAVTVSVQTALAQERPFTGVRPSTNGLEANQWTGHVSLTFGHDDNAPRVSDSALFFVCEQAASFLQLSGGATYWTELSNGARLGFVITGSTRCYSDEAGDEVITDNLSWYGVTALHPEVFLEFDLNTPLGPMTLTPSYAFHYEEGDDIVEAHGLTSHQFTSIPHLT